MANFQKVPGDQSTRFDAAARRLVLTLNETVRLDLFGGDGDGRELLVDSDSPAVLECSPAPVARNGWLHTYALTALSAGEARLQARVPNASFAPAGRRAAWQGMPVYTEAKVLVTGAEFRQAGGNWGNKAYGSMNPAHKNVAWTTMAEAGCGPTSLAVVMDYLLRLDSAAREVPASFTTTSPLETMEYTGYNGRAVGADGQPAGTSGEVMINNVSRWWPDYTGERVASVDAATALLQAGNPLVFLCVKGDTWKYEAGKKVVKTWTGGHFMVLLGYESNPAGKPDTFWITDPSLAHTQYVSRATLQGTCQIWHVRRKTSP